METSVIDLDLVAHLLSRHCFAEVAYFATMASMKSPTALSHMLAGVGCCGCSEPLAIAQRLLEGAPVSGDVGPGGLRVSPATTLPYEGFFHLIEAIRREPSIVAPRDLREVFDAVADDMAYVSRRELHAAPDERRRYTLRLASVSAAVMLRRMTGSDRELPGLVSSTLDVAKEIIDAELGRTGGDAKFFRIADEP